MSELIDNRAQRIRTLKHIIKHLHTGEAPEQVRAQLKQLVQECDATEIAQREQELIAEGTPVAEIMRMCDLHSQVVKEILVERPQPEMPPGHPVRTFQKENEALEQHVKRLREALANLTTPPQEGSDAPSPEAVIECRRLLHELMDIEKHYQRKENLLFPMLERHGITGPSKVMWGKDDEVRAGLGTLEESLRAEGATVEEWQLVIPTVAEPALTAVEEMIYKEQRILLPMAIQTLTEIEWGEVWLQSPQFGWCLVDPDEEYRPPAASAPAPPDEDWPDTGPADISLGLVPPAKGRTAPPKGAIVLPTGALSLEQLTAIFSTLPVDLTFIDTDDRVRFFSEGPDRVFVRPKAVIGRKVQHCHPPASVDIVDQILGDFRAGRQSVAEFWIELHKPRHRFVHIRYFAVRDENGTYLGTLEVTQDLTHERQLTGERRLLQYGNDDGETP
jgi:DUF438 domain-containing protein